MLIELGPMHAVLAASGRSPEIPEAMDLYGWLIGSWELDLVGHDDTGNVIHTTGEAHFAWVLEGRGAGRVHQSVSVGPRSGFPEVRQLVRYDHLDLRPGHPGLAGELVQSA